jgi:methyltransferase-like protein
MYATAASSLVDLYTRAWAPVVVPGDRPEVRPMARYQSGVSGWATNLRHETIHLTPFQKILIPLLNGKRERPVVIRALAEAVRAGKLAVQADGEVVTDPQRVADLLSDTLTEQLAWLGRSTLLVG